MMKRAILAAVGLAMIGGSAGARESGAPTVTAVGATLNLAVGASPPPSFYYSIRNVYSPIDVYSGSVKQPIKANVIVSN